MKEKLRELPIAIQKQVIIRYGAAAVSLILLVVSLLIAEDPYLPISLALICVFFLFSASQLLYLALSGHLIEISGECIKVERTPIRRRPKALYLQIESQVVRLQITGKQRDVDAGDQVTVYVSDNAPVYENEGCQQLSGYLAISIQRGYELQRHRVRRSEGWPRRLKSV